MKKLLTYAYSLTGQRYSGQRGTGIKTLSEHETITSIAQAHNKSAYQVLLR